MTPPPVGRRLISSGSRFEAEVGYSRAVVVAQANSDWVFVSGCTGVDYTTMRLADGVEAQCAQALANVGAALLEAGCGFDDVVRVMYILPNRIDFEPCWPQLRAAFATARPAATMLVAGLVDPDMRIEIEVTAQRAR